MILALLLLASFEVGFFTAYWLCYRPAYKCNEQLLKFNHIIVDRNSRLTSELLTLNLHPTHGRQHATENRLN